MNKFRVFFSFLFFLTLTKIESQNILLVEDDQVIRNITSKCLEKLGHDCIVACDGIQALDCLKQVEQIQGRIDLILMDIDMPNLGGIGATIKIKNDPEFWFFKDVPIIAFTSNQEDPLFKEIGMAGYFHKPFKLNNFKDFITKIFSK